MRLAKGLEEARASTVAIIFLLLCVVSFAGVCAFVISEGINQSRVRLEDRSRAAVQVVATNAGWLHQVAFQTLRRVDAALGPGLIGNSPTMQAAVEGLPTSIDVYIIDASADTIFATIPGAERINVSDREYFTAVRDGAAFYTSGLLVSRLTGEQIFVFSKRVERDGEFSGAIMVSFTGKLLRGFWSLLDLEPDSTVSLLRRDGELMARFPAPDGPQDLSALPVITDYLPKSESGTYFSEASPIDGVSRVVSYQLVDGTDIVAVAAVSTGQSGVMLRSLLVAVSLVLTPVVLALIACALWVMRLLKRDAKRHAELRAANETNVLLFREIHHRVKNNLQSVQSLVRMQDMPRTARIDLQSRLSAMAAMHEHIYRNDRYEDIDAHELIPVVVDEVVHAYGASVEVRYELDHVPVDRDHVTPLALLLSELVTNALKYAFPDDAEGSIVLTLRDRGGGRGTLVVQDDGIGIGSLPDLPSSMGLRLIRGVVSQMGGTYQFTSGPGTRFEAELAFSNAGHTHNGQRAGDA